MSLLYHGFFTSPSSSTSAGSEPEGGVGVALLHRAQVKEATAGRSAVLATSASEEELGGAPFARRSAAPLQLAWGTGKRRT
jgi:hypothetical protein